MTTENQILVLVHHVHHLLLVHSCSARPDDVCSQGDMPVVPYQGDHLLALTCKNCSTLANQAICLLLQFVQNSQQQGYGPWQNYVSYITKT